MSIYGFRWWNVDGGKLVSYSMGDVWPPGETMVATHTRVGYREPYYGWAEHGPVPSVDCKCGLWGFYDPEIAFGLPKNPGGDRWCKVFGVIEAWGGIVWHELGFRAEQAEIRGIVVTRSRLHPVYNVIPRYPTLDALLAVWDVPSEVNA